MKNKIDKELAAELRNRLVTIKSVLELLQSGKPVPKRLIEMAQEDLGNIEKVI